MSFPKAAPRNGPCKLGEGGIRDVIGAREFDDAYHVVHPFLNSEEHGQPVEFVGVGADGDVRGLDEVLPWPRLGL